MGHSINESRGRRPLRHGEIAVELGANVNAANKYENTALMKAAYRGSTDLVGLLLESGAATDAKNLFGNTALMKAAYRGHAEVVEILLRSGADPTLRDNDGKTAMDWARMNGLSGGKPSFEKPCALERSPKAENVSNSHVPKQGRDRRRCRARLVGLLPTVHRHGGRWSQIFPDRLLAIGHFSWQSP